MNKKQLQKEKVQSISSYCILNHDPSLIKTGRQRYWFCSNCSWKYRKIIWPNEFEK